MNGLHKSMRQWTKAQTIFCWVLPLVGLNLPHDAQADPPLPRVKSESGCRVALDQPIHLKAKEPLRVYVRDRAGKQPVLYAVLELRPQTDFLESDASDQDNKDTPMTSLPEKNEAPQDESALGTPSADPYPYEVTAGTLVERQSSSCRMLVGMVAVPQHRDPFLKAAASDKSPPLRAKTAETDIVKPGAEMPQPASPPALDPREADLPDTQSQAIPVLPANEKKTEIQNARDLTQDDTGVSVDQPQSEEQADLAFEKPFLSLFAGLRGEMSQLQGLYIDANIDTSLLFVGPQLQLSLTPLVLLIDSPHSDSLQISYVYHWGGSVQDLKIRREDRDVGNQESSLLRQEMRLGYSLSYFEYRLNTRLDLLWANQKLRHSARFNAGVEGAGSSLRDLETTCLGIRVNQSYTLPHLFTVLGSLGHCLTSEGETPAITTAEYPNANTRFDDSTESDLSLGLAVPIGESSPVSFSVALTARRWLGALTLTEGQIIDSAFTQFGFSLGFSQSL